MSSVISVEINSFWAAFGMDEGVWMTIKQIRLGNTDLVYPQHVCIDQFGLAEICITLCQESKRRKVGLGCGKHDCGKVGLRFWRS